MSLLKLIQKYDRETEAYIQELEAENASLRRQLSESISTSAKAAATSSNMLLRAICAGAFDKKPGESGSHGG